MVRVTVELIKSKTREVEMLGIGYIKNIGGTKSSGDYHVELYNKAGKLWKETKVLGFPRKRLLAWDLLYRALGALVGGRNDIPY